MAYSAENGIEPTVIEMNLDTVRRCVLKGFRQCTAMPRGTRH